MRNFEPGQTVVVNAEVRPRRFAGKVGTVVEVGGEIGVRLGSRRSHTSLAWFRPEELSLAKVGHSPHVAPYSLVRAPRGVLAASRADKTHPRDAA